VVNPVSKCPALSRLFAFLLWLLCGSNVSAEQGRFLYIQSNDIREGQNAVLGYIRGDDGSLTPLAGNPFFTAGTGINNDTHGKLGPNDNDTPLVIHSDGNRLFTVNCHSNTIAVFNIANDGSLTHVPGSPFASHGISPNSLSVNGSTLLVSNRNGDYHQAEDLRGRSNASYCSFHIEENGALKFESKIEVRDGHKPTQVHFAKTHPEIAFGNDFQVDADFDGNGKRSFLAGKEQSVEGQLHVFKVEQASAMSEATVLEMPETNPDYRYMGSAGVPSMPLGIWTHPTQDLLYVGLVTRNELGVFHFNKEGNIHFRGSVPNSGQDICWVLPNKEGTRLYTVNNLPRADLNQKAATVSTYDISGEHAEKPVEIGVLDVPYPGKWFVNNRNFEQPGSTPFQCALSPDEQFLYVICQRINQTAENESEDGNFLHSFKINGQGLLEVAASRPLGPDGVYFRSRPQGISTLNR
jgi:6-phosphogluconolactonase (cycloisomerase 2 family)